MSVRRLLPALVPAMLALCLPAGALAGPPARHGPAAAAVTRQAQAAELRAITGLAPSQVVSVDACPAPQPGRGSCTAHVLALRSDHALIHPRVRTQRALAAVAAPAVAIGPAAVPAGQSAPQPGSPAWLQQAYDLGYLAATGGSADTVAIVDAYGDPSAEQDLSTFRSHFGLPACSTASGCLQIVNQDGQSSPLPSAPSSTGWETEQALDLAAVSSLCPNCRIVLVQANSDSVSDLLAAQQTAATFGPQQISDSWGALEQNNSVLAGTFTFPGVATIASTGDYGTYAPGTNSYPAALPGVTAAGGTTLTAASAGARGFAESAWSTVQTANGPEGGGSGCASAETKPAWQTDTGCPGRAYADVSADADPETGLSVYSSPDGGWVTVGGTSLSAPLIAAYEAVTGVAGASPRWAYSDATLLNDPVSGSTGSCTITYICTATTGYDGPTGAGSISGDVVSGAPGIGGPTVNDGAGYAAAVNTTSASLAGGIYPNGNDTTYYWQYGTTTSYGQQTQAADIGSGAAAVAVSDTLGGLAPSTTYHYRLVAQNSDGVSYGYDYTFTTPASDTAPQNTAAPSATGTATQGQTLTASAGSWTPSGTVSYQWQRSTDGGVTFTDIAAATAATFTLSAADVGATVRVQVTETDAGGASTVPSAATGPIASAAPTISSAPAISGNAQAGRTLQASSGTWTAWDQPSISYQWQRCDSTGANCSPIAGATGSSYSLSNADVGDEVTVSVTASDSYGTSQPASAAAVGPVGSGAPELSDPPTITGTAARASTLTADPGVWSPAPTSYDYQWQRSTDGGVTWADIPGAALSSYQPVVADEGAVVRVRVQASDAYGTSLTADSAATGPVAPSPPVNTLAPGFGGALLPGATLTATPGAWQYSGTVSYRWQRSADGGASWSDIPLATGATYTVTIDDSGLRLRVLVTDANPDGTVTAASTAVSVPVFSLPAPSSPVMTPAPTSAPLAPAPSPAPTTSAPPVVAAAPIVRGPARVGATLRLAGGRYSGQTGLTVRWQRCAQRCVTLRGGRGAHKLTRADAGRYLRAQVTVTGRGGRTVTYTRLVGPVAAPAEAAVAVTHGQVMLRARGRALARVAVSPAMAHASRAKPHPTRITVTRSARATGRLRVWACVTRPAVRCTPARTIRGRSRLVLPVGLSGRLEIIALVLR